MPRKTTASNDMSKDANRPARKVIKKNYAEENNGSVSGSLSSDEEMKGSKRPASPESIPEVNDFGNEMTKLLQGFSNDISKTLQSKRRRVQQYTEESMRSTSKKMLEVCKTQSLERRTLREEFQKQILNLLDQEEVAVTKMKESEDKIQKIVQQQQKQMSILTSESCQRLEAMKDMAETYFKGADELEMRHVEQYAKVHNDMRKEMSHLQKKLLIDTQQQEMLNVRKQLQNMLA